MAINKPVDTAAESLIVERAEGFRHPEVFGTCTDIEQTGLESLLPSYFKAPVNPEPFRVSVGGPDCHQPYEASLFNCSALSFGPMSKQFILAMNKAAHQAGFYQNTGEAGLSPYHLGLDVPIEDAGFNISEFFELVATGQLAIPSDAGDIVWQIGNGYFGCRTENGAFDPELFRLKARLPTVRMIEVKLSQGTEPRKEMPVKTITPGIAKVLGIHAMHEARLQEYHEGFTNPVELLRFIQQLRELSGGKPIGIKLGITHKHWFLAICKAIRQTGIMPDFFTIDGMEAGSAATAKCSSGYTGTPLNDAIVFVHNALVGTNLRQYIRIIASGKVFTERDIVSKLARGADICATARGMLIAVGCDQQRQCYKGTCHHGIATQDPALAARFNTIKNAGRIVNYHRITMQEFNELLAIAGLSHPSQLGPGYVQKRISPVEARTLDELYTFISPGSLLSWLPWTIPSAYRSHWFMADPKAPFLSHPEKLGLKR